MKKIEPTLAGGLRDYLPEDMIPRQDMLDIIREVFERFGFVPLDTPALEKEEILTGGDKEFKKQIFRIKSSEKLALRFDLTVPLARVVSSRFEIGRPFKRYQMGKVWRGESQQFGRYREFMQCDADIVGASSLMADSEAISLAYETLAALGIRSFIIKINNRKILNGLYEVAGFPKKLTDAVLRVIDKLDKQSWDKVVGELEGLKLGAPSIAAIGRFVKIKEMSDAETMFEKSKLALEGISELKAIDKYLEALHVPKDKYTYDFSVARGLGYYTGVVFEAVLTDGSTVGTILAGGRYDGLVERFSSTPVPAVGMSVGIDRLFAALEKLGKIRKQKTLSSVLVLNFDRSCEGEVLKIASDLRRAGIKTDLYLGKEETFKGQFAYGVSHEYPALVIYGSKEKDSGLVQVRDMKAGEQTGVNPVGLIAHARSILPR